MHVHHYTRFGICVASRWRSRLHIGDGPSAVEDSTTVHAELSSDGCSASHRIAASAVPSRTAARWHYPSYALATTTQAASGGRQPLLSPDSYARA